MTKISPKSCFVSKDLNLWEKREDKVVVEVINFWKKDVWTEFLMEFNILSSL